MTNMSLNEFVKKLFFFDAYRNLVSTIVDKVTTRDHQRNKHI